MTRVVCFCALFLPLTLQAQFTYTLDDRISVEDADGHPLTLPWAGGLNAAQFNTMDLDHDGNEDLVVFDRMAGKVMTFLNAGDRYVAAPTYEDFFPNAISGWLLLRDYNCDGKKDIFTGHTLGIKVFRNVTPSGDKPAWEQHHFSTGFPDPESNVLMTEGATTHVNLQLQPDDLPSISDVDGDGDLDILNIQYHGHTIEFHQNLSIEKGLPCDSLDFKRVTRAWGDVRECACGVMAFNGEACPPNSGGRTEHAGGKSLLALDINGDQQQDLLFSEAECTRLYLLTNEGTTSEPVFNRASIFPQTNPVNMVLFPTPYYEDVDFDGRKDLIVTPNIFTKEYLNSDLQNSTWLYKNTGTTAAPAFTLVQRNFLQGDMIDVGDNAVPAFADFEGDGDFDLFISASSSADFTSRIYLYENIGSTTAPVFRERTSDYLNFSLGRYYNLKMQFVDMDGDQTVDLVFTATSFDDQSTDLYYIANRSRNALDLNVASLRRLNFPMTFAENLYVADIDGDGLPDVLAGRSEGNLEYWKNNGVPGAPAFSLENETFLGFSTTPLRQNITAAIADLDGDGHADLLVGDETGRPGVISNFREAGADVNQLDRNLVYNTSLETYGEKNLGGRIWPVVVNLFNTNKPAVVFGNVLGGVHILRHDEGSSLPETPEVNIYPNPVSKADILHIQADRYGTLEIFSILGQRLGEPILLKANEIYQFRASSLTAGVYLLKYSAGRRSGVFRLIVQ